MQEIKQLNAITLQEQLYNELATQIKSGKYKPRHSQIYRKKALSYACAEKA